MYLKCPKCGLLFFSNKELGEHLKEEHLASDQSTLEEAVGGFR